MDEALCPVYFTMAGSPIALSKNSLNDPAAEQLSLSHNVFTRWSEELAHCLRRVPMSALLVSSVLS